MIENYRRFEVVDPYGRTNTVEYRWQQTAISIRHSDSVDVKFQVVRGEDVQEKVVALMHPDLLALSKKSNKLLTDAWCMKLAGLHLKDMIETDRDMEKTLVAASAEDLAKYNEILQRPVATRR